MQTNNDITRKTLKPYYNTRIPVTGVLINVLEPSQRTQNKYILTFASVFASDKQLEYNHINIQMPIKKYKSLIRQYNVKLFDVCYFTAVVYKYYRKRYNKILKCSIAAEHYSLENINVQKFKILTKLPTDKLTIYQLDKIKRRKLNGDIIKKQPNNGSREHYIQKRTHEVVSLETIIKSLYLPKERGLKKHVNPQLQQKRKQKYKQ